MLNHPHAARRIERRCAWRDKGLDKAAPPLRYWTASERITTYPLNHLGDLRTAGHISLHRETSPPPMPGRTNFKNLWSLTFPSFHFTSSPEKGLELGVFAEPNNLDFELSVLLVNQAAPRTYRKLADTAEKRLSQTREGWPSACQVFGP